MARPLSGTARSPILTRSPLAMVALDTGSSISGHHHDTLCVFIWAHARTLRSVLFSFRILCRQPCRRRQHIFSSPGNALVIIWFCGHGGLICCVTFFVDIYTLLSVSCLLDYVLIGPHSHPHHHSQSSFPSSSTSVLYHVYSICIVTTTSHRPFVLYILCNRTRVYVGPRHRIAVNVGGET